MWWPEHRLTLPVRSCSYGRRSDPGVDELKKVQPALSPTSGRHLALNFLKCAILRPDYPVGVFRELATWEQGSTYNLLIPKAAV